MARKGKVENLKPFKKGQSGNPGGRPPKLPALDELLATIEEKDYHHVIRKLFDSAKRGNIRAIEVILDRAFGKPRQFISNQLTFPRLDFTMLSDTSFNEVMEAIKLSENENQDTVTGR